jgi:hypothetical protein
VGNVTRVDVWLVNYHTDLAPMELVSSVRVITANNARVPLFVISVWAGIL